MSTSAVLSYCILKHNLLIASTGDEFDVYFTIKTAELNEAVPVLRKKILKERVELYTLGAIVGTAAGLMSVAFRHLVLLSSHLFTMIPKVIGVFGWIVAPVIGGLAVALLTLRLAPETKGHGVPEVLTSYALQGGKMRSRVPFVKTIASALTISSGGSCGEEGPIAQIGAGIGAVIAKQFHLNKKERKTLLVCGLSSGIASTFNAPLGGTLFGIEVIAGGIVGFSIVPVILSSVIATAITYWMIGPFPSFTAPLFSYQHPISLLFFLFLGLAFGVLSVVWNRGFYHFETGIEHLPTSKYILPGLGGLLVGILGILAIHFEQVFGYNGSFGSEEPYFPAIMGAGGPFIDATLLGTVGIMSLLVFAILKAIATSITLGSGGSGGVSGPILFMGSALGAVFGLGLSAIFPGIIQQPMAFALVGMAAMLAGSAKAPVTAIVIIMEMTHDYIMILPLMAAVSASYLISSLIDDSSIYTIKLTRRGVNLQRGVHVGALKAIEVGEVMTRDPTILSPNMTPEMVLKIIDNTHHTKFPVIGYDGSIIGTIIAEDLFHETQSDGNIVIRDIMTTRFLRLSPDCKMDGALRAMMEQDEGHAVVTSPENPNKMIGFLTKTDVLKAYELSIIHLQKQGMDIEDIGVPDIVDDI
ncbi:chloride channel protein [Candidatus Thorarchaeota archaeon]|nr:MAG: chloride channel protein [Candidatus Thorarchaeota archaeon]